MNDNLFLAGIIGMIAFAVIVVVLVFVWDYQYQNEVSLMSCNELWEEMQKRVEESGSLGEYAFSQWIVRECWS